MRPLLLLVSLLLASPASAQDWRPLGDEATYEAINAVLDAGKSDAENFKALQSAFGPQGVFYGEESTGGDGKAIRVAVWRSGAELKGFMPMLGDFFAGLDSLECARSECAVGVSHAMIHLVLRQRGPKSFVVGVFNVDALLEAEGQEHIDARLAGWRATIDQRYGAQKPLPPVGAAPTDRRATRQAQALNTVGLAALKQKNFKLAISTFERAVHTNPAHVLARYNLACAYSLAGQLEASRAVLTTFKVAKGCPACQARLLRAQTDADFSAQRKDPAFQAIVSGARVPPEPSKTVGGGD